MTGEAPPPASEPPPEGDAAPGPSEAPAPLGGLLLGSFAIALAAVTNGASQAVWNQILGSARSLPAGGWFRVWALLWPWAVPVLVVGALDAAIAQRAAAGRLQRGWRAALIGLTTTAVLRQATIASPSLGALFFTALLWPIVAALAVGVAWRFWRPLSRFAEVLGGLSLVLVILFASRSGLLGAAWTERPPSGEVTRSPAAGPLVILVVFDELAWPALLDEGGEIDADAYPAFAALAAEAATFVDATSTEAWTGHALPSLLTGRRGAAARKAPTLFAHLPPGYTIDAVCGWPWIDRWLWEREAGREGARRIRFRGKSDLLDGDPLLAGGYFAVMAQKMLPLPLRHVTVPRLGDFVHLGVARQAERVEAIIADGDAAAGRVVYWHLSVPHDPFILDRDGAPSGGSHYTLRHRSSPPEAVIAQYREQVRYADRLLGRLVGAIDRAGLRDRAALLVTADHGLRHTGATALEPEGFPKVRGDWGPRIPMMLRAPSVEPGVRRGDAQIIDIAPTLVELAGGRAEDEAFDGVSLLRPRPVDRARTFRDRKRTWTLDPADGVWRVDAPPGD